MDPVCLEEDSADMFSVQVVLRYRVKRCHDFCRILKCSKLFSLGTKITARNIKLYLENYLPKLL